MKFIQNPSFLSSIQDLQNPEIPIYFRNFKPDFTVHSPGRINIIGEHTDYNNGYVLPTAIDKTVKLQFAANNSDFDCNIYSKTYRKHFSFDLRKVSRSDEAWQNYVLGVVNEIQKLNKIIKGFDCVIESDLPVGAGISSSAALECGVGFGINELFHLDLSREQIAEISRNAEHNYVGTKCGIMDQFAAVLSRKDQLMLLDCQNLERHYVSAHFDGYKLLLLNTMVSHNLSDSEYNNRRKECEEAVAILKQHYPEIESLRAVSPKMLIEVKDELSEVLFNRAHYVIEENERVLNAVKAVKEHDLPELGRLMYASHAGLRDEYQVSCAELDFLVNFSEGFDYVLGARMMGGGFGGCTLNLIKDNKVEIFVSQASEAYLKEFRIELQAIPVLPGEGTKLVK